MKKQPNLLNRFYVYRWIRLDTNTPFYVGKGCNKRYCNVKKRNKYFNSILAVTECIVEIILNDLEEQEAYKKEKEFIKMYQKLGYCEANFSAIGNKTSGFICSDETRVKLREGKLGKKPSAESCEKMRLAALNRSAEHKEKLRLAILNMSSEKKAKISAHNKKPEARKINSERQKGNKHALGFKRSEELKEKTKITKKINLELGLVKKPYTKEEKRQRHNEGQNRRRDEKNKPKKFIRKKLTIYDV